MTATPGSASPAPSGGPLVAALQAVLAGEHAAVFGFGVVAGRLEVAGQAAAAAAARAALALHQQRRGAVTARLVALGATPAPAAAAYDLGGPVGTAAEARALAGRLEAGCAGTYADLVAVEAPADRAPAAGWLRDAAVRETGWTGRAPVFPGLAERA